MIFLLIFPSCVSIEDSPTDISKNWAKALILGSGSKKVFNSFDNSIYNSYNEWNTELYYIKNTYNGMGIYFKYISTSNEIINGNNAKVDINYEVIIINYDARNITQTYELNKINNTWKLQSYYELSTE